MQDRMNGRGYSQLILHELDTDTVQTDIEKYVRNALAPLDRISDDQIAKLVADAGVLFIYAATAVRYISDSGFSRNPYGRLQNVLEASGTGPKLKNKAIDELYTVILRAALEDKAIDETERGDILQILHTVVAAQEPLTVRTLSGLLQLDNEDRANTASPELKELAHDAWCFTTSFASNVASASTPHIYISMLPFWPSSRPISRTYRHMFPRLPHADGPAMDMRQLAVLATWSFPDRVRYAAFSPNGSRVVFASKSQLTVVDAYSGRAITGLLHGHTEMITSVEFSPDGTRIVSCSYDKSIRVCDAETGEQLLGPLLGHSLGVYSVQYSPDGTCIASGSTDGTIRIWDAASGEAKLVTEPQEGFGSVIYSIRYSPDGAHIAVGLYNGQLLIRDASTGALTLGPFIGHTDSVTSMDYSPDGTRVASGSDDKTIRVWSAARGDLVLGPFIEHTGRIRSVMYSPNGRHIVSGSDDRTVRVWDAQTGDTILGPLEGHHYIIYSVCYSPDSTRIVSCAGEETVYVWDARSQQKALPAADGCAEAVGSVAYSSDGARVVSGSYRQSDFGRLLASGRPVCLWLI
ncbi:Vegetative incompatibility protein HET-E-1 [Rhizoctonia solani AG-1 IB]|uniref:Vegetative incompatibility protein HET-E-1 n=1 Tax=Thanatephorus cucumeris (strain AG1-IB / isolate 7/3/14) TaxID=1108050 RepID=M5C3T0_THACB|nr:Vegetative incompatibility protein HET-E-1 [Rhizoctonia solani AG-1 IB]